MQDKARSHLPFSMEEALAFLKQKDPKWVPWIEKMTPFSFELKPALSLFQALAESILYQQLTGKAALAIINKLKNYFGSSDFPTAENVLSASLEELRSCGVSRPKSLALFDLAQKTYVLPSLSQLHDMEEQTVIDTLTQVRGIGRWTVEMLLIFRLGRPDILPLEDYGIRKGFAKIFGKKRSSEKKQTSDSLPHPREIELRGKRWRPYRTVASLLLWRAVDLSE